MYRNLEAEMKRSGISRADLGRIIHKSRGSVQSKINGKSPFTVDEVWAIKTKLFPNMTIDYLFDRDGN